MKKSLFILISILSMVACKKQEEGTPQIFIRKQPSLVQVYSVNISSGAETLQDNIRYYFNDSTEKFDSIIINAAVYHFDYSKLISDNKILFNYVSTSQPYKEIIFNAATSQVSSFNEYAAVTTNSVYHTLSYDSINRIRRYNYNATPDDADYFKQYTNKIDTVFIHTERPFDHCISNDTIKNGTYILSGRMPYLLLTETFSTCGTLNINLLKVLPISNSINKLPLSTINGDVKTEYTYTTDSNDRLISVLMTTTQRSTNTVIDKKKITLTY